MRAVVTVFALWLAGLGSAAQFGKLSVAFDLMAARYPEQGAAGIGLIVSIVGIVGLIFGTTAGLLVARIGPRRAIVAALALGAAVSVLQTLPLPYAALILTRVLEGVSHLAIVVVGPTMIAGIASQRHQGLAMTLWSSFFGVTYALLAVIGPPLLAEGSIAPLFLAHAGWMAALALILRGLLPSDPPAPSLTLGSGLIAQHLAIYASPRIAAPALGFVFYTALYVAVLTLLPPLLPEGQRALAAAGMPLFSIAISLTLGVWGLRYLTAVQMVQAGYAAGALATLLLWAGWGQGNLALIAAFLLAGAMGIVQGASFASIPQLNPAPEDRARASGAVAQLGNVGTTTGTPLLALMIGAMGPSGLIAFCLPLCLAGIAVHALQARRRARQA
ncbi:MFS transporter [Tabrizicola sp. TH137]|uniref:MFS transporter n=1 Tax=Tabrizicola sp. TH137 TaxID=2067452 RepID=UPI000C7D09C8|nr:MFS transporter [Tabrizicola sp. TH137]PLL13726.1 MFS transporter [Tabrizicola sp. TH137]